MHARIDSMNSQFCHAVTMDDDRDRVFVHQSECDFQIAQCQVGDIIDFERISDDGRGAVRAKRVTFVRRPEAEFIEGAIVRLNYEQKFAFMRPDGADQWAARSEDDALCHITGFADYDGESATFERLAIGDRVTAVIRSTSRGRRATRVRKL